MSMKPCMLVHSCYPGIILYVRPSIKYSWFAVSQPTNQIFSKYCLLHVNQ